MASQLIDSGADIEAKDNIDRTPLHEAAAADGWVHDADYSLNVARLLIDSGAEIEAKDNNGWKPLYMASANNSPGIARLLIQSGANTSGIDLSWMN